MTYSITKNSRRFREQEGRTAEQIDDEIRRLLAKNGHAEPDIADYGDDRSRFILDLKEYNKKFGRCQAEVMNKGVIDNGN